MTPDEEQDIEQWLRGAPLREPGVSLDRRVAAAILSSRWHTRVGYAAAAAIAVLVGLAVVVQMANRRAANRPVVLVPRASQDKPLPPAARRPISIAQTFGGVTNEGIVGHTAAGEPLRRVRERTMQQLVLIDPTSGKRLTVTTPREDVYLVRQRAF